MNKIIIGLVGLLMIGLVSAATFELGNMSIGNLVAGGSTEANFDFNYLDDGSGL